MTTTTMKVTRKGPDKSTPEQRIEWACLSTWDAIAPDVLTVRPKPTIGGAAEMILDHIETYGQLTTEDLALWRSMDMTAKMRSAVDALSKFRRT